MKTEIPDTLTDFERAEYYKKLYEKAKSIQTFTIIVASLLCFVVGYLLAKLIYTHHHIYPFT